MHPCGGSGYILTHSHENPPKSFETFGRNVEHHIVEVLSMAVGIPRL